MNDIKATTKAKSIKAQNVVIDAGNGNTKIWIAGHTEIIPSVLCATPGDYIRGGFRLGGSEWTMGWDCLSRPDKKMIGEQDTGKLDFLPELIAGAISAQFHLIRTNAPISLHILTLNVDKRNYIEAQVQKLNDQGITVDGIKVTGEFSVANIYPEGYGASLAAASWFKDKSRVCVLDVGNGTMNLSQYFVAPSASPTKRSGSLDFVATPKAFPRRESFTWVSAGVSDYVDILKELMTQETSNGRVEDFLLRQALESNRYLYLSNYEGMPIWETASKAAQVWIEQPKVKRLLVQVRSNLQQGIPVLLVGGGNSIKVIQETLIKVLDNENLHAPDEASILGVKGLGDRL